MNNLISRTFNAVILPIFCLLILPETTLALSHYNIVDIGSLGGPQDTIPNSINDHGQITGYSSTSGDNSTHAFIYGQGIMRDLGTIAGSHSVGYGINNLGHAVGVSQTTSGWRGFFFDGVQMVSIGTLGGSSQALDINNAGHIVGQSYRTDGTAHAFLFDNNTMTDLGTLAGNSFSIANSINDAGQIVGISYEPGGAVHAFLYNQGSMTDLGVLGNRQQSYASCINNLGQIVGDSSCYPVGSCESGRAFLYYGGQIVDLGTLGGSFSLANSINDRGVVVGTSGTALGFQHAFVYENGIMTDLNSLIDPNSGWVLETANSINNLGQITGTGIYNFKISANPLT